MASIVLETVERLPEGGQFLLRGSIDGQKFSYKSSLNKDGTYTAIETEFFLILSERGLAEQGNSALYHIQLGKILWAAHSGSPISLPFTFGPP